MTDVKRVFKVNGKPFFPVGAQVDNSSGYNESEYETGFKAMKLLHGNTLQIPVYWEQVEPEEGKFDFSIVDSLLASARRYGVKLILLWFATWKNGNMDYTPAWVKTNTERFKRVKSPTGSNLWGLSSYCTENLKADKKAFAALCKHLKAKDSTEQTVIGIQVENEPWIISGQIGCDRDYSPEAQAALDGPVPAKLLTSMKAKGNGSVYDIWQQAGGKKSGNWSEVFGSEAGELVSAWSVATYIDGVSEAGKAVYDIPMYINAWIIMEPCWHPSPFRVYPTGGPISKVLDIYKWFTPHVDLIGPDIHLADSASYKDACVSYSRDDNSLFDCEAGPNTWSLFHGIAEYNSIGYTFFGIEDIVAEDGSVRPESRAMVDSVQCIAAAVPLLLKYQGTGKVHAVVQDEYMPEQWLDLDGYIGQVQFGAGYRMPSLKDWRHNSESMMAIEKPSESKRSRGLVIQANRDEFYLVGVNYRLSFLPKFPPDRTPFVYYNDITTGRQVRVDEGHFDQNGEFVVDRQRNADPLSRGVWVEPDVGVVRVLKCD